MFREALKSLYGYVVLYSVIHIGFYTRYVGLFGVAQRYVRI